MTKEEQIKNTSFKWLHLSDLHFQTKQNFNTAKAKSDLNTFIEKMAFKPDYVFITGDIADKNDYADVSDSIAKLIEAADVKMNNVYWAVGNHDIKRKVKYREDIIKKIRDAENGSDVFNDSMLDEDDREILTHNGMKNYHTKYKEIFGRIIDDKDIANAHKYYPLHNLNLIVLNTCLTSCDNSDALNLFIMEQRIREVFAGIDKNKPTFVIGHHGLSFFNPAEQTTISHFFDDSGVDVYLCGHSHKLGYSEFGDTSRTIHQFTCGGGDFDRCSQFCFLFGEYDDTDKTVKITPYSYKTGTGKLEADFSLHRKFAKNPKWTLDRLNAKPNDKHMDIPKNDIYEKTSGAEIITINSAPKPTDNFVGRVEKLQEIRDCVKANKSIIVNGMGGIGKSEICRKLFHEYNEKSSEIKYIGWLVFNGSLKNTLYGSFYETKRIENAEDNFLSTKRYINRLSTEMLLFIDNMNVISEEDRLILDDLACTIS